MATLREIRRRIAGVKSTQKITKAMKMVATAKLRRTQDAVISARPYARKMKELLNHIAGVVDVASQPLFMERPLKSACLIVITADRGLCGAFNANVIRAAISHMLARYGEMNALGNVKLICIGKKGYDFFQKNNYTIAEKHLGIFSGLDYNRAQAIAQNVVKGFLAGEYDSVEVVYNEFKSIVQQRVVTEQFLPILPAKVAQGTIKHRSRTDYIYEPSGESIISSLLPKHLNFQLWHMLLESAAAEQSARMTAMDNATTNASDLIQDLQLVYNKARQSSITKELLEIVSGAEALRTAG